jgi:small subunit ribosomal protein S6
VLLEVEGSGGEIAEVERRMRVNDQILRYMTVRVDEARRRAEKLKARRARKAAKQPATARASNQRLTLTQTKISRIAKVRQT